MNITKIHQKVNKPENISLNKLHQQIYALVVVAKSTASREKLNLLMANDSTPLTRAFFVRSLRTPKENTAPKSRECSFLSMVGRNGQSLVAGCEPLVAVSHPVTLYHQAVRSKAVDIKNLLMELSQMFYKFLCVNRTKHTYNQEIITIQADTEENARFQLSADYRLLLDRPIAKVSQNLTACNTQPRPTLGKVCGTAVHPTNTISFQVQGGIYA